jgi:hypothetical protein
MSGALRYSGLVGAYTKCEHICKKKFYGGGVYMETLTYRQQGDLINLLFFRNKASRLKRKEREGEVRTAFNKEN